MNSIEFKNFKIFNQAQRFILKPITILTGTNSSGKSSMLQGIDFMKKLFTDRPFSIDNFKCLLHSFDLFEEYENLKNYIVTKFGNFTNILNRDSDSEIIELSLICSPISVLKLVEVKYTLRIRKIIPDQFSSKEFILDSESLVIENILDFEQKAEILDDIKKVVPSFDYEKLVGIYIAYIYQDKQIINYLALVELGLIVEYYSKIINAKQDKVLQPLYNSILNEKFIKSEGKTTLNVKNQNEITKRLSSFLNDLFTDNHPQKHNIKYKNIIDYFNEHEVEITENQLINILFQLRSVLPILYNHQEMYINDAKIPTCFVELITQLFKLKEYLPYILKVKFINDEDFDGFNERDLNYYKSIYELEFYQMHEKIFRLIVDYFDDDVEIFGEGHPLSGYKFAFSKSHVLVEEKLTPFLTKEYLYGVFKDVYSEASFQNIPLHIEANRGVAKRFGNLADNSIYSKLIKVCDNHLLFHLGYEEILEGEKNGHLLKGVTSSLIIKYLKIFEIGDSFKIDVDKDSGNYKVVITKNKKEVNIKDLGFGISQVLPIILICNEGSSGKTIIIEEPESNLHPALQSKVADLLVEAKKRYNINFIIETHSEYFIRRLQYLTAKQELHKDDSVIYYFNNPNNLVDEQEQIFEINITQKGQLTRSFGEGFFDEASNLALLLFDYSNN
jgi:predicted ATPase